MAYLDEAAVTANLVIEKGNMVKTHQRTGLQCTLMLSTNNNKVGGDLDITTNANPIAHASLHSCCYAAGSTSTGKGWT